jgi:hypothetical protein
MIFPELCCPVIILLTLSLNLAPAPSAITQEQSSGRPDVEAFLDEVATRYKIDRRVLAEQFVKISRDPMVIQRMQAVPPGEKSWLT